MCQKQFHATPAHVYQNYQSQVRLMVKCASCSNRESIAETNGVVAFRRSESSWEAGGAEHHGRRAVHAMEIKGAACTGPISSPMCTRSIRPGPDSAIIRAGDGHAQRAGRGRHDHAAFVGPGFRPRGTCRLIGKAQQSPAASSEDRVKFFKLAWDAVGSEFASRHTQYEMSYAGANFVTKGHSFRTFDWDRCTQLVDRMLDGYSLADELSHPSRSRLEAPPMTIAKEHRNSMSSIWRPAGACRRLPERDRGENPRRQARREGHDRQSHAIAAV